VGPCCDGGGPPYVAPPKTTVSYRSLADVVLEALAQHVRDYPAATAMDERGWSSELVFADEKGRNT